MPERSSSNRSDDRSSGTTRAEVVIANSLGLHARPAALFVQLASRFNDCEIRVSRVESDEEPVDGKSIMGLMMLAAAQGTQLNIEASGPTSGEVVQLLSELVENRFGEE